MGIVNVFAFIVLLVGLSRLLKRTLIEVLPVCMSVWVLILYWLAMGRRLSWIDGIAVLLCTGGAVVFVIWCMRTKDWKNGLQREIKQLWDPAILCFGVLVVFVLWVNQGRLASEWDSLNYWATDVKALFYNHGFAEAYQNVSAAFGDYPPAAQLAEYWVMHIMGDYKDGYIYAGYYIWSFSYLAFLLKYIKADKWINLPILTLALTAIISVVDISWYISLSPDAVMGVIFGVGLLILYENRGRMDTYAWMALTALSAVLVLVKNIAIVWFLFLVLFYVVCNPRKEVLREKKIFFFLIPLFFYLSWFVYCRLQHRVANSTSDLVSTGKSLLLGTFVISENWQGYLTSFWNAFLTKPLHCSQTNGFDFTPVLFLVMMLICLYKLGREKNKEKSNHYLFFYFLGVAAVAYLYILLAHLTIFAGETQYLEADTMIRTISRYGDSFTLGAGIFVSGLFLHKGNEKSDWKRKTCLLYAILIMMGMNGKYVADAFQFVPEQETQASEVTEAVKAYQPLFDILDRIGDPNGRILIVNNQDMHSAVSLMFAASPVSVADCRFAENTAGAQVIELYEIYHAKYIYFQYLNDEICRVVLERWGFVPKLDTLYYVNEGETAQI